MEKKHKELIVIIILVVLLLGLGGYIYYDKIKNNEIIKKNNDNNTTVSLNKFNTFAKTLKENRMKQSEKDKQKGLTIGGNRYSLRDENVFGYIIKLDYDGTLSVEYSNKKYKKYNTIIDTNVLFYEMIYVGNGGYKDIFYVKDNGKLYTASVELDPFNENKIATAKEQKEYKNIVRINQEFINEEETGFYDIVLVDINGNIYYLFSER